MCRKSVTKPTRFDDPPQAFKLVRWQSGHGEVNPILLCLDVFQLPPGIPIAGTLKLGRNRTLQESPNFALAGHQLVRSARAPQCRALRVGLRRALGEPRPYQINRKWHRLVGTCERKVARLAKEELSLPANSLTLTLCRWLVSLLLEHTIRLSDGIMPKGY